MSNVQGLSYAGFLDGKSQHGGFTGFEPLWLPPFLFDFQAALTEWAIRRGKAAIFADCGLGKTPMQLVWAENVVRKENRPVLIVTPLAVSAQTIREAEKFGIECRRAQNGVAQPGINVTNYERLHHFNPNDFIGVVCDESSILKNFDGVRRGIVTEFMRTRPYRLLCTATAAPNDYIELGTSAEALGELGFMDMLARFFKNQNNTSDIKGRWRGFSAPRDWEGKQWRFKKHARQPFWRWVSSWARALRRPSDLGFEDGRFVLPELIERETVIENTLPLPGMLFAMPAVSLHEQRQERRVTINRRCEEVAGRVNGHEPSVVWCHLNQESRYLTRLIQGATEVSGDDTDEAKEEAFLAFARGDIRVLITKPRIGAFGLNWQHCAHMTFFPSHSFEQYYQAIRRCWRYGQMRPVVVDVITTTGEAKVLDNLQRKAKAADQMFSELIGHMNESLSLSRTTEYPVEEEMPSWL